jgi:hypothetical protein
MCYIIYRNKKQERKNKMKELIEKEFNKIWNNNRKMVDYCMKKVTGVVQLENGKLFCFEKPSIETHFCFGYGQNGISTEEDFENALQEKINASKKEYFVKENIKVFDRIEKILNSDKKIYSFIAYLKGENIVGIEVEDYFYGKSELFTGYITDKDKENLLNELENQKKMFMKRLETYWKKYGSSKLKTWTYLVD